MPRYFFDTDDGKTFIEDDEGHELADVETARLQAQGALADMAHDVVPKAGPQWTVTVRVRDEAGKTVLRAALSLLVAIEQP